MTPSMGSKARVEGVTVLLPCRIRSYQQTLWPLPDKCRCLIPWGEVAAAYLVVLLLIPGEPLCHVCSGMHLVTLVGVDEDGASNCAAPSCLTWGPGDGGSFSHGAPAAGILASSQTMALAGEARSGWRVLLPFAPPHLFFMWDF